MYGSSRCRAERLVPDVRKNDATPAIIARIVAAHREKMDISQEALARLIEVDRTYVAKIERGILNPTIYRLNRLLSAMGVTWEEFGRALDHELALVSGNRGAGRARRPPGRKGP
jgi:transcriptional regulator with XRE-family HTH domain